MNIEDSAAETDRLNAESWTLMVSNPDKGLLLSKEAYKTAFSADYRSGIAESLLNQGWCYILKADSINAFKYLNKALSAYYEESHGPGIIKTLNALGVICQNTGQYDRSLDYFAECLELSRKNSNSEYIISSLGNIGEIYYDLGKTEEALEFFRQEEKLLETEGSDENRSDNLQSLGMVYGKLEKTEKALGCLNESLEIAKKISYKYGESACYNQLGNIYLKMTDYTRAERCFLHGFKISAKSDFKKIQTECLTSLGYLKFRENYIKESLYFHNTALEQSKIIKSRLFEYRNYYAIAEIYEKTGEYDKALYNYKKFYNIKNDLLNEETEKKLKQLTLQSDLEKKQRESEIYKLRNVELKEAYNNITVISRIGQEITKSLDMEVIMMTVSANVERLMPADFFGIALYDEEKGEINFKYYVEGKKRLPEMKTGINSDSSLAACCIKNKKYILINDLENESSKIIPGGVFLLAQTDKIPQSIIYIPLKFKDDIIGVMTVQSIRLNSYTEKHVELLTALASYVTIALENSLILDEITKLNNLLEEEKKELVEAYEQISVMAHHDNLTGLPNRKLLDELFSKEMKRAVREGLKIAVLFIDLDGFKAINDTLGHDAGDKVLVSVSETIRNVIRGYDTVARIGGDEFIIIAPGLKNEEEAGKIAEKIILALMNTKFTDAECCSLGGSIGISFYPDDDQKMDELITKSDQAMYHAKSAGKNTYRFFNRISK